MKSKGQVFSADFLVAVVVILFVMTTLQVYHSRVLEDIQQEERMVFQESLTSRTDTLLMFEGRPENWDEESVEILGFSTGVPNRLNGTKLLEYFEMDEERAEELLGFHGHEFYLSLENKSKEVVSQDGVTFERGERGGWEDATNVYSVRREVSVDGMENTTSLKMVVW